MFWFWLLVENDDHMKNERQALNVASKTMGDNCDGDDDGSGDGEKGGSGADDDNDDKQLKK